MTLKWLVRRQRGAGALVGAVLWPEGCCRPVSDLLPNSHASGDARLLAYQGGRAKAMGGQVFGLVACNRGARTVRREQRRSRAIGVARAGGVGAGRAELGFPAGVSRRCGAALFRLTVGVFGD